MARPSRKSTDPDAKDVLVSTEAKKFRSSFPLSMMGERVRSAEPTVPAVAAPPPPSIDDRLSAGPRPRRQTEPALAPRWSKEVGGAPGPESARPAFAPIAAPQPPPTSAPRRSAPSAPPSVPATPAAGTAPTPPAPTMPAPSLPTAPAQGRAGPPPARRAPARRPVGLTRYLFGEGPLAVVRGAGFVMVLAGVALLAASSL